MNYNIYYFSLDPKPTQCYNYSLEGNIMETIKTELRLATKAFPKHQVLVFVFKFDNIRQESYWVLKTLRCFRLKTDAEMFQSRF